MSPNQSPEGIRLQKVLAAGGYGSRRSVEDLIRAGRVTVNGEVAVLGQRVSPGRDRIAVDGTRVATNRRLQYLALNKPRGVITTRRDPQGRPTVRDLVDSGAFPVGRLDADTEGLLLLTNDGELAHRLTHPSFEIPKTYVCEVEGAVELSSLRRLTTGVRIDAVRPARAAKARILSARRGRRPRSTLEIVVHEGRKRVVRRMLEEIGHPVIRLVRTRIGPIGLARLRPGQSRALTPGEVRALFRRVGL